VTIPTYIAYYIAYYNCSLPLGTKICTNVQSLPPRARVSPYVCRVGLMLKKLASGRSSARWSFQGCCRKGRRVRERESERDGEKGLIDSFDCDAHKKSNDNLSSARRRTTDQASRAKAVFAFVRIIVGRTTFVRKIVDRTTCVRKIVDRTTFLRKIVGRRTLFE
jgi:hypothetical protein